MFDVRGVCIPAGSVEVFGAEVLCACGEATLGQCSASGEEAGTEVRSSLLDVSVVACLFLRCACEAE
jgi:hypothetical protein